MKFLCTIVGCLFVLPSIAQFTISGSIKNDKTALPLEGATIQIAPGKYTAVADKKGWFEIQKMPAGEYTLYVRFLGFENKTISVALYEDKQLNISLQEKSRWAEEVTVYAMRLSDESPIAFSELDKQTIQTRNAGRDMPFILEQTPSLITTSDAGAGVGYTGLRIRGSDATRVNITINGIPFNDSESHGVFWVNMPDIASSAESIQVQRGVGASTNGAGAFGASINLNTGLASRTNNADLITSYGSFNTHRHTLNVATGPLWKRFSFGGRFSLIQSDGFIDRAFSDLKSFYVAGKYQYEKTTLEAIAFGGDERTYQSWNGIPQSRLENDETAMRLTAKVEGWNEQQLNNLLMSKSRTFNVYTYKDQVDNYAQNHYQFHASHHFSPSLRANIAFHYTYGRGYFEEFKYDQSFQAYGLLNPVIGDSVIAKTDLIRRRGLSNHFYGFTYLASYRKQRYTGTIGGAWNHYTGTHFGRIIWAEITGKAPKDFQYYVNTGDKYDFNIFWKSEYRIWKNVHALLDIQYRHIDYKAAGNRSTRTKLRDVNIDIAYNFFNPKVGITYSISNNNRIYVFYGIANREPVRKDFVEAPTGKLPKPETVYDLEAGWRIKKQKYALNVNAYWMQYKNQHVLTGELNNVGAAIRTGVPESYRLGIEIDGTLSLHKKFTWQANAAFSRNKIEHFTEIIYDYGSNFDKKDIIENNRNNVDISFSPSIVAASTFTYRPIRGLELTWFMKYVGDQFLDNTSNRARKVDAYFVNDLSAAYTFVPNFMKALTLNLFVYNIFNAQYESYGYTYGYRGGGQTVRQNYYFPQAGINYMMKLVLRI